MIKVKDLTTAALPQAFLDVLPETCPFCGAETEITEGLTSLCCTNSFCRSKLSERMVAMLADLGVKNMGASKCASFIEAYNLKSPYALFDFANRDGTAKNVLFEGCSKEFSDSITQQVNQKRNKLLWEYVKIGNLPGIRDSAKKLFQGYNDINDFYNDLKNPQTGGILFITKLLDIKSDLTGYIDLSSDTSTCSVKAVSTFKTLMEAEDELKYYQQFFDIKKTGASVSICISTSVGAPYTSKSDFVDKMNTIYDSVIHINFLSSVSKQCDVLVWAKRGAKTSKVEKATKAGIPILTGRAFDKALSLYKQGKDLKTVCAYLEKLEDANPNFTDADINI